MYLCQELAKLMETNVVPDQVCTLLEFVKPNVRPDEIVALLKEATKYKDIEEDEIDEADEGSVIKYNSKHFFVDRNFKEKITFYVKGIK